MTKNCFHEKKINPKVNVLLYNVNHVTELLNKQKENDFTSM